MEINVPANAKLAVFYDAKGEIISLYWPDSGETVSGQQHSFDLTAGENAQLLANVDILRIEGYDVLVLRDRVSGSEFICKKRRMCRGFIDPGLKRQPAATGA